MSSFFFISGYTTSVKGKPFKNFILDKAFGLLIPVIGANILFMLTSASLNYTMVGKILNNPIPWQQLWTHINALILRGEVTTLGSATWFLMVLFEAAVLVKVQTWLCCQFMGKLKINAKHLCLALSMSSILQMLVGYKLYAWKYQMSYWADLSLNGQFYFSTGMTFKEYNIFEKSSNIITTMAALFAEYYFTHIHWYPMNWPTRTFSENPVCNIVEALSGNYLLFLVSNHLKISSTLKSALLFTGNNSINVMLFHFMGMKFSYILFYVFKILQREQLYQFVPPNKNKVLALVMQVEKFPNSNKYA